MARRGMTGQLNMFDFFRELETNIPQDGELEMVSLMPSFEEDEIPVSSVKSEPMSEVAEKIEEQAEKDIKQLENKNEIMEKDKKKSKSVINKTVSQQEKTEVSKILKTIENNKISE